MLHKLQKQLKELGSKLKYPPSSKDGLIKLLKQAANFLSELDQSPSASMMELLQPFFNEFSKPELLKHQDRDVKLLVATCICEITRITAPEAPYNDDTLREIFTLIVGLFSGLSDTSSTSFGRRVAILDTLAKYRSCIVMLDLECYDLIKEMFSIFFSVVRDDTPEHVRIAMETVMVVIIEESEDVPDDMLLVILSNLGRHKKDTNLSAWKLAVEVIKHTAGKLESEIKQFLISSISGNEKLLDNHIDYHEVIYDIYHCAPNILLGVIPYLTEELLTVQVDVRLKAVYLMGNLFSAAGSSISEEFQPIFSEFLKRSTDRVAEVRMAALEYIQSCLLSNPSRPEACQILSTLREGLLDPDENVRRQVISVICDVSRHDLRAVPVETVKLVAERLQDESVLVRMYTLERLAEIYMLTCLTVSDDAANNVFDWIPGKILRFYYETDIRSDTIEYILSVSLFPSEFSAKNKVKHWVKVFAGFDKVEVKALEKILEQKQKLQEEMQKYISLKQIFQREDAPEFQKKVMFCFKVMSPLFPEPSKAEELFQTLDQIKDENIWRILTNLLNTDTSSHLASVLRDDLLKILGENHHLYDFLGALSVKLSYALFDKEHVQELLLEASVQKADGNTKHMLSCMKILTILAQYCPSLFSGTEKDLTRLLKDDNEIIRQGILHVLAKAGSVIKEQLAVSSSSINLTLETLCLEGSRNEAKYAVRALAAISKDDGLMSLSVLYKRLVDMLEEKTHLPTVLQSLGCIAQTAMPVFETRETEIVEFINTNILNCSSKVEDINKTSWDDISELCSTKIFAIKAMVKSYLPVNDTHLRPGIDNLIEILKNLLLYGEMSKEIISSSTDKAHMKLASAKAILRLSRCWDQKIPADVFHLVVRSFEVKFPEFKNLFLRKIHQYLKDMVLDGKYACAFITNMASSRTSEFKEDKQKLRDVIQMCNQMKAEQFASVDDTVAAITYPECILSYLIHVLSHQSLPNIDECKDLKAYEQTYRQLLLFISLLVYGNEDCKSTNIEKENERIMAISSILVNIKSSEDVVDTQKSKNSHAICDLGISIIKRLAQKEDVVLEATSSVTLPSVLYKPMSKTEEIPDEGISVTWLADESSLAHFYSLKLDTDGMDDAENEEKDIKQDNTISLGKIMKSLKHRSHKKKRSKKMSPPAKSKSTEHDVGVRKMMRELNTEKLELPSNGHGPSPNGNKKVSNSSDKRQRPNGTDTTPIPLRKRRRSWAVAVTPSSRSKSSAKRPARDSIEHLAAEEMKSDSLYDSGEKLSSKRSKTDYSESNLLVSSLKKKGGTSKQNDKTAAQGFGGRVIKKLDNKNNKKFQISTDIADEDGAKTPMGSSKKRKQRSVSVLAKCTAEDGEIQPADLVGCRIKVWWPLDREFYEGVVKSYKKMENQHVIIYDDGDVEMLSLNTERWELADCVGKSGKEASVSKKSKPSGESSKRPSSSSKKSEKSKLSSTHTSSSTKKSEKSKISSKHTSSRTKKSEKSKISSKHTSSITKNKSVKSKTSPTIVLALKSPMTKTKEKHNKQVEGSKSESVDLDVKEHESDMEPSKSSQSGDAEDNDDLEKDEADVEKTENKPEVDSEEKLATEDPGIGNTTEPKELGKPEYEVEDIATTSQNGPKSLNEGDPKAKDKDGKSCNQEQETKEMNNNSRSPQLDHPDNTPSSAEKPDNKAQTSSTDTTVEAGEDEPLSMWKQRANKKSK